MCSATVSAAAYGRYVHLGTVSTLEFVCRHVFTLHQEVSVFGHNSIAASAPLG